MITLTDISRKTLQNILILISALAIVAGCSKLNQHVPEDEEKMFGTDGVISRYHTLLNTPFSIPLVHQGYIVGIEKSPRDQIRFVSGAGADVAYDAKRLRTPSQAITNQSQSDIDQQNATFLRATDDGKVMFVSHILEYSKSGQTGTLHPKLFYSAYSNTAFGADAAKVKSKDTPYEDGWRALNELEGKILEDIKNAKTTAAPYTHLVVMAMGWNNDQIEALERYNSILEHSRRASGGKFNPLVLGLTWPSVWGGTSVVDVANRALHLASYPVKTLDADEIGYAIGNHMINAMLPRIENETGIQPVLVGHSLGVRMLTRAYYSADLLNKPVARKGKKPIIVGLLGAFSANRFREDFQLIPPIRWLVSGEGGPYQNHADPGGAMVLTWSDEDNANPIARFVTGAAHVGGKSGARSMKHESLASKILFFDWKEKTQYETACATAKNTKQILYVNGSNFIAGHGDIRTPEIGKLVWQSLDCLSAP